jgi:hypothetical protein
MTPLSAWSGLFLKELSHNSPARDRAGTRWQDLPLYRGLI